MKLDLMNVDDFTELNHLKEITNPGLMPRAGAPHPEGLLSEDIFGVTPKSRKNTFAYIDLHGHFFAPHVYKIVRALFRNIDSIINGTEYYTVKDGKLVKDPKGETGIDFVYKNWKKIKWEKSEKEGIRNQRVDVLSRLPIEEAFWSKCPVIPVFYRDTNTTKSGGDVNDLNNLYTRLIRFGIMIAGRDMFDFSFHQTNMNIQNTLVLIYDYFKGRLEKKTGMIRKYLMGKSVDYSTRTVITAPRFDADRPDKLMTSIVYAGVPIHQICSLCYPFVLKWLKDFFERNVVDSGAIAKISNDSNSTATINRDLRVDRPELTYTDTYFKKAIDSFIKDPSSRFDLIPLKLNDGSEMYLSIPGLYTASDPKAGRFEAVKRPATWTDLLYIACSEIVKDKHLMTTRYPVLDQYGTFFNKIHVLSTQQTQVVKYGTTIYDRYPIINFKTPKNDIASLFIDSTQYSNSFLEGIGGDYDGDQTTSRILWTQEANDDCEKQMNKKNFYLSISGDLIRTCSHEANQTFYVLTKNIDPNARRLKAEDVAYFVSIKPEDYTFTLVTELFADYTKMSDDRRTSVDIKSKYNYTDIIELSAKDSPTGKPLKTTLGRYILYRALISFVGIEDVIPFFESPIEKKGFKKMEKAIAYAYQNDKIDTKTMQKYIDTRDWIGYQWHSIFCTSFSPAVIKIHPEVRKLKNELLAKNKDELDKGNAMVSEQIEKALVDKTRECFKGDLGMDLYDSGARGSLENNYKNNYLYRGAVENPLTGGFDIIRTALSDGLKKEDIPSTSNSILSGAYPKACGTAVSGYIAKQLLAQLQTECLDAKGTDCGSKNTINFVLTDDAKVDYRYIVDNGKLVLLTKENRSKYTGKMIHMRSPMCCLGKKICNICGGEQYYIQQIENIGLMGVKLSGALTNGNMKKFHSNLIKSTSIDPKTMIM